jgi:hypothetical protein
MSDRSSMRHRVARGLALVLSVSLGALVVVNAQFGCDAPASNPPASNPPAPKEAAPEPAPRETPEPAPAQKPVSEPAVDAEPPATTPAGVAEAEPDPTALPSNSEPVFMPASKSGGDFGSMHFPGEQSPTQQQQQQNPAPQR